VSDDTTQEQPDAPDAPPLRLVRGRATPEELAALVAVLAAAGGGTEPRRPAPVSLWADRARLTRPPLSPGPGGWRASALPR
jgi:predicted RNase H-like nuclease (RuvC/YqgF family)